MADLQPTSPVIADPDADVSADSERAALAAREAALARAAAAEQNAALAQRERDAADARIRAALARAARERAAAALSPINDIIPDGTGADSTAQLSAALLQHEATALLNLHAQAVAVQNIRALVPLLLDVNSTFYSRWRESFLLTLIKFSLDCHVLSDVVHHSPDWTRMNAVVLSWINDTITDNLADTISERGASARVLWLAIESQFLGNRTTRTLYADQAFRSFTQGDLSVAEYCHRYKKLAEDLRDLGEPVSDKTLVLNIIRGLNERFQALGLHLRRTSPLPTFLQVCDDLTLEELTMTNAAPAAAPAAVTTPPGEIGGSKPPTSTAPAGRSSRQPPHRPPSHHSGGGSGHGSSSRQRGKRGKRGGRTSGNSSSGIIGPAPSSNYNYYNPWTGPSTCGLANVHLRLLVCLLPRPHHHMPSSPELLASGQFPLRHMGRPLPTPILLRPHPSGINTPSLPTSKLSLFSSRLNKSGILILVPPVT
jgi:hypothetical protein